MERRVGYTNNPTLVYELAVYIQWFSDKQKVYLRAVVKLDNFSEPFNFASMSSHGKRHEKWHGSTLIS